MEITAGSVGKGIAAIGGSGAGGYGIYALATEGKISDSAQSQESAGQQTKEAPLPSNGPDFLFQVTGFGTEASGYGTNSFGYAFGRFMLNPRGKESLWEKGNENYDSLKDKFQSIKKVSDGRIESSQQICEEIHKRPKTEVLSNASLLYYTWQFCSISDSQLETVKYANRNKEVSNEYKGKWAWLSNNPDALFDASRYRKNSSDWKVWEHLYKNVLKVDKENSSKQNDLNKKFKDINSGEDLGKECETAYKSTSTENATNYGRNVREYCILDASITLSQYPTEPSQ